MELLDLRYDAVFKEFFKDRELLGSFISSITGRELTVESLEYTEEKAVDDGRSIIFDILAIDKDGHKINVEMEKNASSSMKKRTQFYWAKAFTRGFEKNTKFKDLKETICINILGKDIFQDDIICREYVLYDIENKSRLDECLSIYFVELQKAEGIKGESVKDLWIRLLSNSKKAKELPKESPIIKKAVEKVERISEVDDIQFKVIQEALEESKLLDWKDDMREEAENMVQEAIIKARIEAKREAEIEAKREAKKEVEKEVEKAKKEAEIEAKKEVEKAKKEAKKEAEIEVKKEVEKAAKENIKIEKLEIAKNLLDILDNETIALKTGLIIDEINKLR